MANFEHNLHDPKVRGTASIIKNADCRRNFAQSN